MARPGAEGVGGLQVEIDGVVGLVDDPDAAFAEPLRQEVDEPGGPLRDPLVVDKEPATEGTLDHEGEREDRGGVGVVDEVPHEVGERIVESCGELVDAAVEPQGRAGLCVDRLAPLEGVPAEGAPHPVEVVEQVAPGDRVVLTEMVEDRPVLGAPLGGQDESGAVREQVPGRWRLDQGEPCPVEFGLQVGARLLEQVLPGGGEGDRGAVVVDEDLPRAG